MLPLVDFESVIWCGSSSCCVLPLTKDFATGASTRRRLVDQRAGAAVFCSVVLSAELCLTSSRRSSPFAVLFMKRRRLAHRIGHDLLWTTLRFLHRGFW